MLEVIRRFTPAGLAACIAIAAASATAQPETTESTSIRIDPQATEAATSASLTGPQEMYLPPGQQPPSRTTRKIPTKAPLAPLVSTETVVIATWKGGEMTNQELSATLQLRKPKSFGTRSPEEIKRLPGPQQREIIRDLAFEEILFERAKAEGITEEFPEIAQSLKQYRQQTLGRLLFEREVEPQLRKLDEQAAREFYEKRKDELFISPASTSFRNLHLSTLMPYTVKEGDTTASVALEQLGTEKAAHEIYRGSAPFYYRLPRPENADKVPIAPLVPGEQLLIPLKGDDLTSKTRLAEEIRKRLLDGEDFDQLREQYHEGKAVDEYSEPLPAAVEGLATEIRNALDNTKETSVSEVVKTDFGLDLLYISERKTTSTIPFEDVKEQLISQVASDQEQGRSTVETARVDVLDRLAKQANLQLNEEALKRDDYAGSNQLPGNTPLATLNGFTYTLDDFLNDLRPTGRTWQSMTADERTSTVRIAPGVTTQLVQKEAERLGLDKNPRLQQELESKAIIGVTSEYLRRRIDDQVKNVFDEELRAFYQDHIDQFTSPSQVVLREITKRINMAVPAQRRAEAIEGAKKELAALKSNINSQQDFEQAARRESEAISTRSRGGLIGTVPEGFRGESFRNQVEQLKPGEVSDPFLYGSEVMIIRLDERQPPIVQPFESVQRRVRSQYLQEKPQQLLNNLKEQVLKEANFELKI